MNIITRKGIRCMEFETTEYDSVEEILQLIAANEGFHDAEIAAIQYNGKDKAEVAVTHHDGKSYSFVFDSVSSFTISGDPAARWVEGEISLTIVDERVQVNFFAMSIYITAKKLTVNTTRRIK